MGANLEEAAAAQTKRDFISKNSIALKEAQESRYWLRVIEASDTSLAPRVVPLRTESSELVAMLVACIRDGQGERGSRTIRNQHRPLIQDQPQGP